VPVHRSYLLCSTGPAVLVSRNRSVLESDAPHRCQGMMSGTGALLALAFVASVVRESRFCFDQ
jgi:hypothetical protein